MAFALQYFYYCTGHFRTYLFRLEDKPTGGPPFYKPVIIRHVCIYGGVSVVGRTLFMSADMNAFLIDLDYSSFLVDIDFCPGKDMRYAVMVFFETDMIVRSN